MYAFSTRYHIAGWHSLSFKTTVWIMILALMSGQIVGGVQLCTVKMHSPLDIIVQAGVLSLSFKTTLNHDIGIEWSKSRRVDCLLC